jgi:hypothetical protein
MERGHSQRQACELIELPRSMLKYRSLRAERDVPALDAMRRIAATYPRYGYRRVRIFLRREGHAMSPERAYRLWRTAGLQLPRRRPRRRVAISRPRPLPACGPNQVWAYDFVHDACANGQKLKCLTVIDEFTRECLAIDVAGSIRSARVIDVLSRLISAHGTPAFLRSDNGPEFVSKAILEWLAAAKIDTVRIPAKLTGKSDDVDRVGSCGAWRSDFKGIGQHRCRVLRRNHFFAVVEAFFLRSDSPVSARRWLLCTTRSRIASASVGSLR